MAGEPSDQDAGLTYEEGEKEGRKEIRWEESWTAAWTVAYSKISSARPIESPHAKVSCWRSPAFIHIELVFVAWPCSLLCGSIREKHGLYMPLEMDPDKEQPMLSASYIAHGGRSEWCIAMVITLPSTPTPPPHHQRKLWILWTHDQFQVWARKVESKGGIFCIQK